jgi:hypothetical protein
MRTILIADSNEAVAESLARDLRRAGFNVVDCAGPWPPALRCIRCDIGYCPLTEGADAMIYQADLTGLDRQGRRYNLALASALAHPELPMFLVWHGECEPLCVAEILSAAPNAARAPEDRAELVKRLAASTVLPSPV